MKVFGTIALAVALAMGMLSACSTPPSPAPALDTPATLARSYQYTMTSQHTGRAYVIQVSAPIDPLPLGVKAPVIYVTDGNWYFGMATDIVRLHQIGWAMEPAFVVAIGYPDPTFKSVVANRETDLLHNKTIGPTGVMGGGGAAFLDFLTDELRPFIETRFPVDPGRSVLTGQSLGGLFAANVLLKRPDSFSGYLIGSPSVWADNSLLKLAGAFTAGKGQHVFVGVGGGESQAMRDGATALAKALSAPSAGLSVEHRELAQHSHTSMLGAWFATGLYYLLPKPPENK